MSYFRKAETLELRGGFVVIGVFFPF